MEEPASSAHFIMENNSTIVDQIDMEYDKRMGTTLTDLGIEYEKKMIAYYAIKCCCLNLDEFWIASNADGLEAFDDIVLYTKFRNGKKNLSVIQLKHKEMPNRKIFDLDYSGKTPHLDKKTRISHENIYIEKYVKSYKAIENIFAQQKTKHINTKSLMTSVKMKFPNVTFIFLTNTDICGNDVRMLNDQESNGIEHLCTKPDGKICQLSSDMQIDANFKSQFYLFANQIGCLDNEIDQILGNELNLLLKTDFTKTTYVLQRFVQFIEDWFNQPRKLTKQIVQCKLAKLIISSYAFVSSPHHTKIKLPNDKLTLWNRMIEPYQVVIVEETDSYHEQLLDSESNHTFTTCDKKSDAVLFRALQLSITVKIILMKPSRLTQQCDANVKSTKLKSFYRLRDLSDEALTPIYKYNCSFQGRQSKFGDILKTDPSLKNVFTSNDVLTLLGSRLILGTNNISLPEFYVQRSIPRITLNLAIFKRSCEEDVVFIIVDVDTVFELFFYRQGMDKCAHNVSSGDGACEKCDFRKKSVVLQDTGKIMEEVDKHRKKNLHIVQLHWIKSEFIVEWMHSLTTDINIIIKSVDAKASIQLPSITDVLNYFNQSYRKKMLIVANPGMGKSVLMHYLASIFSTKTWIMLIILNDIDYEKVTDYESFLQSYKNSLTGNELPIFETFLRNNAIIVLYDGYDEVAPTYVVEASAIILGALKNDLRVIVTSREVTREKLETLMNVKAYTLQVFNKEDQINFLAKYYYETCRKVVRDVRSDTTKEFAVELLKKTNFSNWDEAFTGVPLQCRMLAEAFTDECLMYCRCEEIELPDNLNLLDLYEMFVSKKFTIYWEEKGKLRIKTAVNVSLLKKQKLDYIFNHKLSALEVIFPESSRFKKPSKQFLQEIQSGVEKCGLILGLNVKNVPIFIHRTFAEYFSALWLAEHYRSLMSSKFEKLLGLFKLDGSSKGMQFLLRDEFSVVRDIFDRILSKGCELHTAVLNHDVEEVKKLMKTDAKHLLDLGGRSALHLAAGRGAKHQMVDKEIVRMQEEHFETITNILLENKTWNERTDEIIAWTPLQYVEESNSAGMLNLFFKHNVIKDTKLFSKFNHQEILYMCSRYNYLHLAKAISNGFASLNLEYVKILLRRCVQYDNVEFAKALMDHKHLRHKPVKEITSDFGQTLLHESAKHRSLKVIKLLLKVMPVNIFNEENQTPLHIACELGHLDVVKLFIEHGGYLMAEGKFRKTPLDLAREQRHADIVEYLTSFDVLKLLFVNDINKVLCYKKEDSALHLATRNENIKSMQSLLNRGANSDILNVDKKSPLYYAAEWGSLEAAKVLVENGANLFLEDNTGKTALDKAIVMNHSDIMDYLTTYDILKNSFGDDANTVLPGQRGYQAIHLAACANNCITIGKLITAGANINSITNDGNNWTALHCAATNENLEAVKMLVESGADVNLRGKKFGVWSTALTMAGEMDQVDIFKYLVNFTRDKTKNDVEYYKSHY